MIIGQNKIQEQIGDLLKSGKFPRFSIFIGDKGSGRRTVIREKLKALGEYQECELDAESVRETIEQAYRQVVPTVYVFADADSMSVAAKNAMLKVTEEPPNNAYFIMTLMNTENTLNTIKSRATLFYMDTYNASDLLTYYNMRAIDNKNFKAVEQYCTVLGDIDMLLSYSVNDFQKFIGTVIDNAEKVSGANSFKIGNRLNLGTDESKYDLGLFFKAFRAECLNRIETDPLKYIRGINVTNKYLGELRIAGINKQMLFDSWLLDLRKEWL